MIIVFLVLKYLVLFAGVLAIIFSLKSAKVSYDKGLDNTQDFCAVFLIVVYICFDLTGKTMGLDNTVSIENAISIKVLSLIFCLYIIQMTARNIRQAKLILIKQEVKEIKYSGIDRRKHEA